MLSLTKRRLAGWALLLASVAAGPATWAAEADQAKVDQVGADQIGTAPIDPTKPLPASVFAQLPFMERPSLSPNGDKIATRMAINGTQLLVIIDVLKQGKDRMKLVSMGENDLKWWQWVNEDWLIAGIGTEQPVEGDTWYISRTIGIRADGQKLNLFAKDVAAQNADDVIWVARDGTSRILLAYQTSIYADDEGFWPKVDEIDVSTGKMRTRVASRANVRSWYADASGIVRMGVGYIDATRTSMLLYRQPDTTTFRTVSRANRRKYESLVVPQLFLADPGKAVATDDHEGADALYEYDLATLELGKKIFGVPGFDVDSIVTDSAGTGISGITYTDDRSETHWLDPDLAQVQAEIDKAVGTRRASIISTSRDQSKLLVHVGAPDRAGSYYYFDRANGTMNLLAAVNESLKGAALSPVKTIRYKARDGLEIAAVLTLPKGKAASALPLILMPHGGPFARDSEEWDWWVQFLANRGYAVLQPNYRGSSGYGTAFAQKGEGQWGLAMQDDLNDAVDWAVKEGIADPKRVCMVGASYGGYAAMRAAQRDGAKYRCAISYAGVSDLSAMVRYDSRFLNSGAGKDWVKEQAPDFRAVSPINFASDFSTPILLMHGKKDRRVQVKQSREMAEKLKLAGKNYIYIEQPLADHFFSREADRLDFLTRMEAFLKQYNPA